MHHGPVPVDVEASSLVGEIVSWAARHPKQKDIILVDGTRCGLVGCIDLRLFSV